MASHSLLSDQGLEVGRRPLSREERKFGIQNLGVEVQNSPTIFTFTLRAHYTSVSLGFSANNEVIQRGLPTRLRENKSKVHKFPDILRDIHNVQSCGLLLETVWQV